MYSSNLPAYNLLFKPIKELYQSFKPGPRRLARFNDSSISAAVLESISQDSSPDSSLPLYSSWRTSSSSSLSSFFSSCFSSLLNNSSAVDKFFFTPSSGRSIGPRRYVAPLTTCSGWRVAIYGCWMAGVGALPAGGAPSTGLYLMSP